MSSFCCRENDMISSLKKMETFLDIYECIRPCFCIRGGGFLRDLNFQLCVL